MTVSDYSKSIVATACWLAAPKEPHHVMLCIAMVFRNQAQAGWFDGDIYECAAHWLEEQRYQRIDTRNPEFQKLLGNLDAVVSNLAADKTDGALWFGPKTEDPVAGITMTAGQIRFVRGYGADPNL